MNSDRSIDRHDVLGGVQFARARTCAVAEPCSGSGAAAAARGKTASSPPGLAAGAAGAACARRQGCSTLGINEMPGRVRSTASSGSLLQSMATALTTQAV